MDSRQKCITIESRIAEWVTEMFMPEDVPEVTEYFGHTEIAEMIQEALEEET